MKDIYQLMMECRSYKLPIHGNKDRLERMLVYKQTGIYHGETECNKELHVAHKFLDQYLYCIGKKTLDSDTLNILNEYDFYSSISVGCIPKVYYFELSGTSDAVYACDVRSLNENNTVTGSLTHPYNLDKLSECDEQRYNRKMKWLDRFGYVLIYPKQNKPNTIDQLTTNVFSNIIQYSYVDAQWYIDLGFDELKQLYHELKDIWSYRLNISDYEKRRIIPDCQFCTKDIRGYTDDMEDKLRRELLIEINKLVTQGTDEFSRKNGAMYFMLGLVLVSQPAADCNPSLFQASYVDPSE